jgi:hypothetical protein
MMDCDVFGLGKEYRVWLCEVNEHGMMLVMGCGGLMTAFTFVFP